MLEKVHLETTSKQRIQRDIFKTALNFAGNGRITALEDIEKIVAILKKNGELNETSFGREQTVLTWAAGQGHIETVRILLQAKANVEVKGECGETALTKSVDGGHFEVVKILLEAKADVDVKGFQGITAVMYAAMNGHVEILKLLLKAKANIDARGTYGETAIMRAASEGHIETVKILLHAKANIENKDDFSGRTAAQIAKAYGFKSIERAINQFAKENSELKK
jgi:ankyrin repeat protein